MRTLEASRRTEVCVDGTWTPAHDEQLEIGDLIRIFNADDTPLIDDGASKFLVTAEPAIRLMRIYGPGDKRD